MSEDQINEIREIYYEMRREFPFILEIIQVNGASMLSFRDDVQTEKLKKWYETYLGLFSLGIPGKLGAALGIHLTNEKEESI